jgi:hypothetical protein
MDELHICDTCGCPTTAARVEPWAPDERGTLCPRCAGLADAIRSLDDDSDQGARTALVARVIDWCDRADDAVIAWRGDDPPG